MSRVLEIWEDRLRNWALYKISGNGSAGVSTAYDGEFVDRSNMPPPPLVGEALDTDSLVMKLPLEQVRALTAMYVWSVPERMEERARILGIHVNTLNERVRQAKFRLDDLDQARRRPQFSPMLGLGMA